ncbi:hypothetical protein QL285_058801 [Trifolium repens]|nr:hypothetical protein QL285_058801 [Trifolium repens]
MIGLGFDHPFKKAESAPEKVTPPLQKPKDQISGQKSQHPAQHKEKIIDLIDHISQHCEHTKKEMTSQMSQHPDILSLGSEHVKATCRTRCPKTCG